jgi:hypothetical protein
MKLFFIFLCCTTWVFAQSPHENILITNNYAPNEPTLSIDPKNPNILLGGSNIDNLYLSDDGGRTWSEKKLRSSYGVWGDPVIICDTASNFYFFHLSNPPNGNWIDRIVCQKTSDNGQTWTNGSYMGLDGKKAQDKHWAVVDPNKNYIYTTWTQFDKYGSKSAMDKSSIMFSMSKDEGKTWTTAKKINEIDGDCIDSDNTTEGAVPAMGPNGEVYVAWGGPDGLVFDRSLDEGKTWLDRDIKIDPMPGGWDYKIPGIYRCNGMPVTACDITGGAYHGTIYVNWSDQRNGTNDTDVWLSKSTDQGETWSDPIRVNDDPSGRHQFLTWMTIEPTTGDLYFVFYDRRNTKGEATEVYMARSTDGGNTFTNFRVSQSAFTPNKNIFFGDYNNIVAYGNTVRPIWTRLDGSKLGLYTALVDIEKISPTTSPSDTSAAAQDAQNAKKHLYVSFKLHEAKKLTLHLLNSKGKRIQTLFRRKHFSLDKHIEQFELQKLNLSKGKYSYELKEGCKTIKTRTFEIE